MNLSPNFTLEELTKSDTAKRLNIDNSPTPEHLQNLKRLAGVLEQVRTLTGKPINITSGYRSPKLNKATGGSLTSSHLEGLAADLNCPGFGSIQDVCNAIAKSNIEFDQLIFEQGANSSWCHIGVGSKMRRQILSWSAKTGYVNGIKKV